MWCNSIKDDEVNEGARMNRNEMFCSVAFRKRMVIGGYFNTLKYVNLHGDKDFYRRSGEPGMSVSTREFHNFPVHISNYMNESGWRTHHAWIVPLQLGLLLSFFVFVIQTVIGLPNFCEAWRQHKSMLNLYECNFPRSFQTANDEI